MKRLVTAAFLAMAVVLVAAAPAQAGDTVCSGGEVFTGEADNIVVPAGELCVLLGATVHGNAYATGEGANLQVAPGTTIGGNVEAKDGAATAAFMARIGGSIKCDHCIFEDVVDSTVGGNVEVKGADEGDFIVGSTIGGNVEISESAVGVFAFAILDNSIGGNLKLEKNAGAFGIAANRIAGDLQVFEHTLAGSLCAPETCPPFDNGHIDANDVGGNVQVFKNKGAMSISGNTVAENLQCGENNPAPSGSGNTAGQKEGQCRSL